jgi:hypothetical protein
MSLTNSPERTTEKKSTHRSLKKSEERRENLRELV